MRVTDADALVRLLDEYRRYMTNDEIVRIMFLREQRVAKNMEDETKAEMRRLGYRVGRYGRNWSDWRRLTITLLTSRHK